MGTSPLDPWNTPVIEVDHNPYPVCHHGSVYFTDQFSLPWPLDPESQITDLRVKTALYVKINDCIESYMQKMTSMQIFRKIRALFTIWVFSGPCGQGLPGHFLDTSRALVGELDVSNFALVNFSHIFQTIIPHLSSFSDYLTSTSRGGLDPPYPNEGLN